MNNKFDEITKSLSQSVIRQAMLKEFGAVSSFVGLLRLSKIFWLKAN